MIALILSVFVAVAGLMLAWASFWFALTACALLVMLAQFAFDSVCSLIRNRFNHR